MLVEYLIYKSVNIKRGLNSDIFKHNGLKRHGSVEWVIQLLGDNEASWLSIKWQPLNTLNVEVN